MIGIIAFTATVLVLAIPTAILIAVDVSHAIGQRKRDRLRRRVSRMRFAADEERFS